MQNISGFGLVANLVASNTFPLGIVITQFADDADPLDAPSMQIGDSAMGLNGDLITWSKANPVKANLNVIPGSLDDINLSILFEANRVARGKIGAHDVITLNLVYPNGNFVTLTNGLITDGMPINSVASAGREKSKNYNFTFENKIGA
jgi:hypothetical protein